MALPAACQLNCLLPPDQIAQSGAQQNILHAVLGLLEESVK